MDPISQYDYDKGEDGPLSPLLARIPSPRHSIGIEPPKGWIDLVLDLDAELSAFAPDYQIAQVKEKFGGLRFYIESYGLDDGDPRIDLARELVQEAEAASFHLCQVCGAEADTHHVGWLYATLCEAHLDEDEDDDYDEDYEDE